MGYIKSTTHPTVFGHPALCLKENKQDITLFGRYGQVWKYDEDNIMMMIGSIKIINKAIRMFNISLEMMEYEPFDHKKHMNKGDEIMFKLDKKHLPNVLKLLKVSKQLGKQVAFSQKWVENRGFLPLKST